MFKDNDAVGRHRDLPRQATLFKVTSSSSPCVTLFGLPFQYCMYSGSQWSSKLLRARQQSSLTCKKNTAAHPVSAVLCDIVECQVLAMCAVCVMANLPSQCTTHNMASGCRQFELPVHMLYAVVLILLFAVAVQTWMRTLDDVLQVSFKNGKGDHTA